jgi:glycosyltransferase involved in cell wall biosynthesis
LSQQTPRIFLLVPTFQPHDAVGNDVLGMLRILRDAGYDAAIYAEHVHADFAKFASKCRLVAGELWRDPRAILIYHHAIDWKLGEEILRRSKNKIVIKYHNITPPEFFEPYAPDYSERCVKGMEATRRLAQLRVNFVWGASQYNNEDFIALGVPRERCRVAPPIHRIEALAGAPLDAAITGAYRDGVPNILFVGAFRPNKGHCKALDVFAAYRRMTACPARLFFVGSFDRSLAGYEEHVKQYARALDVHDDVFLAHSVTLSQLRSYYTMASVFLCVSEHEGFCVPLVEAMHFRAPIVAWANAAVGETCDGCGTIFDRFDEAALARALEECLDNPALSRSLADRGRQRYETAFSPAAIRARLLELVEEAQRPEAEDWPAEPRA